MLHMLPRLLDLILSLGWVAVYYYEEEAGLHSTFGVGACVYLISNVETLISRFGWPELSIWD
jgi:hypothetical protein